MLCHGIIGAKPETALKRSGKAIPLGHQRVLCLELRERALHGYLQGFVNVRGLRTWRRAIEQIKHDKAADLPAPDRSDLCHLFGDGCLGLRGA